jgi:8-oxo-dGTP diphosphatase
VLEETGHEVSVHEFLGSMSHADGTKLKIVQFWRMRAAGRPVRKVMRDIKAVQWLPLEQAAESLTHAHEQAFLANVGPMALEGAARCARDSIVDADEETVRPDVGEQMANESLFDRFRAWFRRVMQGGGA